MLVNPRKAAIRQSRVAARDDAEPRPTDVHRHLGLGKAKLAVNMMAPPEGNWGMPIEELKKLPSYGDPAAQREEARKIMEKLGYGPATSSRSRSRPATSTHSVIRP